MTAWLRATARLLCLALMLTAAPGRAADADAPAAEPAAVARQILVMLHLPAPHFRPDASYGGAYNDNNGRTARRRIAQTLARANGLTLVSDWPMPLLGVDCYVMEVPAGMAIEQVLALLSRDPDVEWAQPVSQYRTLGERDPLYRTQPSAKFWHIDELHQRTTGRDVRVAVIDSGVQDNHPDLLGQVAVKENFVDESPYAAEFHGTAVAGIIAARAGNGVGIEGVAPGARLMALRACWEDANRTAHCNSLTLGKAFNFALMNHAQVINLSLTGPQDRLLERLIAVALGRGIAVVGAVDALRADGGFPASYPGVIAVTDERERAAPAGLNALAAPGTDVPSTEPGSRWGLVSGTSFAAAHVSGMLALLVQLQPALPAAQLRRQVVLKDGAIDACASVARAAVNCSCACAAQLASKAQPVIP